ncbi:glycosyltransferase family 4 protein [Halomonas sp. BC04]|uniref:glycosyltransferase family 4 protein n=1 Tax=Halomonas sp. BC04 TaxID=1403540 RepID=UPI0009E0873B|nr:glycosyltransferase family 4 protein [Halomonas sp. BC04]
MKIAIVNQHIAHIIGGSELQCDYLALGLADRGHQITYFAPGRSGRESVERSYSVICVENTARSIISELLETRPDVVYWRYNKHHFREVAEALAATKIPMVFAASHINDLLPWAVKPVSGGVRSWPRQFVRKLRARWQHGGFRNVSALITLNRDLLPLSPVLESHYVPNGMSSESVPFFWPRPYVAWVANIKPAKRPEAFVEVTQALKEYGIDGLMVGHIQSGGYEWLEDPEQTPENFHYLGPRTPLEVNGLLAASRLHVHTCQPEGFGNVYIQAWMQGKPSISLEYDPCGYIVQEGIGDVCGGDVAKFGEQVVAWAINTEKSTIAGALAKDFANRTFSVDFMVRNVESILEKVI